MADYYIPQGTTEPQKYVLEDDDGNPLEGLEASHLLGLEITDRSGATVDVEDAGEIGWDNAAAARVVITLLEDGLTKAAGPYRVRWTVSDADGNTLFKVPNERDPDRWIITHP